jgi:large repetitive protein
MPPAAFRGQRRRSRRSTSVIIAIAALATVVTAGQAIAATSLHVSVTAKPKAVTNTTTATFKWKARGKVKATLCSLDSARFRKCRSGKRYTGLKDGKHRFRVEVKGSGTAKKLATVKWLVDTIAPTLPVAAGGSLSWQAVPSINITASGSTDAGSGLAGYEFRTSTDGGATWSAGAAGALASASANGETLVQFRALDKAGNASDWAPAADTAEATARVDNLAPFGPTVSGGDLQWQNTTAVTISASAGADVGGAGFDHYEYRTSTDGGTTWSAPATGASVPISADGETDVQFRSVDAVGNKSGWAPTTPDAGSTVRLDRTIPTDPIVTGGTAGWQNIASTLVTAGGSTDAQGGGVAFYQYRFSNDGGATWSTPTVGASLLVSAEGQTLVDFRSVDTSNNDSAWMQASVQIDRTNPSVPGVSGGSPAWQSVPSIDISASGATDSGGSGVAAYQYRESTDGGLTWWLTPVNGADDFVTAEGQTIVQFRTVDGAGNTSGWVSATARIDRTIPSLPIVTGGSSSWQNAPSVDVNGSGSTDSGGSAVAGYQYRTSTDGGQTWSSPSAGTDAIVSAEGKTLVQFQAIDGAGNLSGWAPAVDGPANTVMLDHTVPTLSGVSGGSLSWKNQASTTITAGAHADAGGSGFSHDEYRTSVDGGATWSPGTGPSVTITDEGETIVQFRAVDNAGNASAWFPASPTAASTVRLDRTNPTDPTVSGGSSSWQSVPSVLLSASASTDAGAGVTGYEYRTSTDGGATWSSVSSGSSLSVSAQGATQVGFRAVDGAGRKSNWVVANAKIDRTPPGAPAVSGGSPAWKTSASVTVSATLTSDTGGSGFAGDVYETSTDGGATWSAPTPGSSLIVSNQGETLVQFAGTDNAGNQSAWVQATVRLDRTAPTAPNVTGGSLSWGNAPVTISASGSTDVGGSGFVYQYRTSTNNGASWSAPVTGSSYQVTADGTTLVQFQAIDGANNTLGWTPASPGAANTVKIDTTAPTAPTVSGGSSSWQKVASVTVTALSTDAASGVAGYQYRTSPDGSTWSAPTAGSSALISAEGTTYVQFQSTDNAGNHTAWTPAVATAASTVKLDHTLPVAPTVSGGSLSWSTSAVTLNVTGGSDALSGVQGIYVRTSINGGSSWSAGTLLAGTTYQVSTQGTTLVQAQTIDNAGNASAWSPLSSGAANTVKFDNVAPTLPSASGGLGAGNCRKHITVSVVASSDAGSGVAHYDYRYSTNAGSTWSAAVTNQSSFSPSSAGTYYVQFRAVDNAGNISGWGPASPITGSIACVR